MLLLTQATDSAVPSGHIKKHKYPAWFSWKSNAYINKIIFIDVTRSLRLIVSMTNFLFTGNQLKKH
jgi:hypothetical protein